jgi:hypothetical protein
VFNELSGTVEQVGGGIQEEMDLTASSSPTTPYRSPFNQLSHENFTFFIQSDQFSIYHKPRFKKKSLLYQNSKYS